ncbi:hypothetical protein EC973_007895 [Apophysomyces ossiformis]|uniref:Ras-GEF domain-containing protein n=1 Tax=Apophysomyces ossiformis TaxID=679940 RepID=A0A8H7BTK7_9FUNG|nr:hypothetical protein EC973_007895 [Apophysomyces ossiformis]
MDDVQSSLTLAAELEDNGQFKDAYMTYLTTAQRSLQSLYDIKFVHSSIVAKPKQYTTLLSTTRTCLTHIESIIERHSPTARIPEQRTGDSAKAAPPPLPPKPSRIQKPHLPPKPSKATLSKLTPQEGRVLQDNTPDFHSHQPPLVRPRVPLLPADRPHSLPPPTDNRPIYSQRPFTQIDKDEEDTGVAIRILAEGKLDPNFLAPAQTNAGDSLSPPTATIQTNDQAPLIPVPPLLTAHRMLQEKSDDLEALLKDYRKQKQRLAEAHGGVNVDTASEDRLNQAILRCSRSIAETRQTLNRVRTLYMSAATVPTVMQFQAHLIAYQITLIEASIFNAIPSHALLEHSAKHPHPRIVASTDFFNYVTRFIEHSILLPQDASARAQHVHYWIKVAARCFDLNNYQTLKAIVSALGTPPVQRLRRTWAYIPKKSLTKLDSLNELMSEADNYGRYREHMGMVSTSVVNGKSVMMLRAEHYNKPTVPFLGTFIHDITYLLAACKSSQPREEPRIREILLSMTKFQEGPKYSQTMPNDYLKATQKHHFRPALSNALHRGASGISRISGGSWFGFGADSTNHQSGNHMDEDDEENLEEQQQMATQYILMRSWVNQNTIDALSMLREPPRQKNSISAGTRGSGGPVSTNTNSAMSNSSSMMRFSTGSGSFATMSTAGQDSRPTSVDDSSSPGESYL